jgi:UDP-N-acetyl-D-mannosaminuronic acid transferase (WecB/TagA/CpsF family)
MRRLLIATGAAAVNPADLPSGVQLLLDAAEQILVVAPSLPTQIDWITSDTDRAKKQADERLRAVLGQLDELGVEAHGEVGSDEPLEALEDAIRSFSPDHLLIAIRSESQAGWQERGLLDEIQRRFGIPMTVFQLPFSS